MKRMISRVFLAVVTAVAMCIALGSCQSAGGASTASEASSAKAEKAIPAGLRVYYASHSLMWDVPAPLGEAVNAYGIKDHVLVGLQRLGFSRTTQHWDLPDAQNQAKPALNTGNVDVFLMSPMDLPDEGIDKFVKLGLEHNPKMRFILQVSWGGFDTDGQKTRSVGMQAPRATWNDKTAEQLKTLNTESEKAFEAQADEVNQTAGKTVLNLIPTSQALIALRTMIVNKQFRGLDQQSQLFVDFIGHPSPPLISLNMYLHFAVIYKRSPVGLPMPTILKQANNPQWDEDFNKALQELAWKTAVEYSYSGVKEAAKPKR
jgi:hypothetical protein